MIKVKPANFVCVQPLVFTPSATNKNNSEKGLFTVRIKD
jgi:hypothetical protein